VVGDLSRLKLLVLNITSEWLSEARLRVLFEKEECRNIKDLLDEEPVKQYLSREVFTYDGSKSADDDIEAYVDTLSERELRSCM
jgi:hypothetical protein